MIKNYLKIPLLLFLLSFSFSFGQTAGISLSWDKEVGCQKFGNEEGHDPKDPILISDISNTECVKVCENTTVQYTLSNLPPNAVTTWNATGGTASGQSSNSCTVNWGNIGDGNLSFSISSPTGVISKSICIKKIPIPIANFEATLETISGFPDYLATCLGQNINFTNLSSANNGSGIISYLWTFYDGSTTLTSAAQNPQYTFTTEGECYVTLTVTNACNCSSTIEKTILVGGEGFNILCPSIVCEGERATYSLPFDGMQICKDKYNWTVTGGNIINEAGGNVDVLWNNVGPSGFGTVTFNPEDCNLECLTPTTIKVPVIQSVGTISGDPSVCLGSQYIYSLPQWPTTDFQWEITSGNSSAMLIQSDQRNEVILSPLAEGFVTIKCTYMNTLLKCGGTAEYTIEIVKPINFTGETVVCQGGTIHFNTENGEEVNWDLNGLPFLISTFIPNSEFNYTLPSNFVGNVYLSINNVSTSACPSQTKSIRVIAKPRAPGPINGETIICPNAPYVYHVNNPIPQNDYVWEVTGGDFVGSNIGGEVTVIFNATGPYNVKVYNEALFPTTCRSTARILNVEKKIIDVEIKNNDSNYVRCTNTTDIYSAYINGTNNLYTLGEQYTWSINPPTAGSITSGQNTNTINVLWNNVASASAPKIHLVTKECTITEPFEKEIQLVPSPQIAIATLPVNTTICSGTSVTFTVSSTNGVSLANALITWNFNGTTYTSTTPGDLTHTFAFNNTSGASVGKVVTAIISNICSMPSNTALVNLTVLTGPDASVSLGNNTANAFCDPATINSLLIATTASSGATFQWYKNNVAIPGATTSQLQVSNNSQTGFGDYYVVITGTNGCSTPSNFTHVLEYCTEPFNCTISPTPTLNNNSYADCKKLYVIGSTGPNPTPVGDTFHIYGPESFSFVPNNTAITLNKAGIYQVFYNADYVCNNNPSETGSKQLLKQVVVPYLADFAYTAICANNNSFSVTLIDKSEIFAPVNNIVLNYGWRPMGSTGAYTPITSNSVVLEQGNYQFQLIISGNYLGSPQTPCIKTIDNVNLQSIGNNFINNGLITCDYKAIDFSLNNTPNSATETILWTFENATISSTLPVTSRVFNAPGTYTVTATVRNNNGCERTFYKTITIPPTCFSGDVVSNPSPATVCKGYGVLISYNAPSTNACLVDQYVWMKDNEEFQITETNNITVYEPGFYWLKVYSENGCEYSTPSRITPAFRTPPALRIKGPTSICTNEDVTIVALTTLQNVTWKLDNNPYYNTYGNEFYFSQYPFPGEHTVTATVTDANGCSNSVSLIVTIYPEPDVPVVNIDLACAPFQYTLSIVNYNPAFTYNWSNGQTGGTCNTSDGGAFSVTVHVGGCEVTNNFDLAKNPSNYTWIFPSGCFSLCEENQGYLIGPRALFDDWHYDLNEEIVTQGENIPLPFSQLNQDGDYTLTLQTQGCEITTPPLVLDTQGCEDCKILRDVFVKSIKPAEVPYCAFNVVLYLASTDFDSQWFTLSNPDQNIIIVPSTLEITSGPNMPTIMIIPINGFTGTTFIAMRYYNTKGELCETLIEVTVPSCDNNGNSKEIVSLEKEPLSVITDITLYPNPAKELVNIDFSNNTPETTVTIYDITGRLMQTLQSNEAAGIWQINTSTYQSGLYIVTVSSKNNIVKQYKLIIE